MTAVDTSHPANHPSDRASNQAPNGERRPTPLTAATCADGERPPVRIIHLGLGAFHRAHQAVYTAEAGDGWGIAAFTGRSPQAATALSAQDGLYTLVVRAPAGDRTRIIGSLVETHDGAALDVLCDRAARPEVGVITLTITEAGYRLRPRDSTMALDASDPQVAADVEALPGLLRHIVGGTGALAATDTDSQGLSTAPARLVLALAARRAAQAGGLAVVPCDNLPGNGAAAQTMVLGMAERVDSSLAAWIRGHVSFVSTSVDRITPRTTDQDREEIAQVTGHDDVAPVITEPFSSWILAGDFPAGRPAWEKAGALVVDDVEPFERRKLWLLNGAHSLLAYAGQNAGHSTVSSAIADETLRAAVEEFWDEACRHLPSEGLDLADYRTALVERFANPRIAHRLAQIGADGSLKLAARQLPVLRAEREAGRPGTASLRALAAWAEHLTQAAAAGEDLNDPAADSLRAALARPPAKQTAALLHVIDPHLAEDTDVVDATESLRAAQQSPRRTQSL